MSDERERNVNNHGINNKRTGENKKIPESHCAAVRYAVISLQLFALVLHHFRWYARDEHSIDANSINSNAASNLSIE